jgi:hypothetical protein
MPALARGGGMANWWVGHIRTKAPGIQGLFYLVGNLIGEFSENRTNQLIV